eukprot:9482688-Pyramimonas_sp.AAC.2
MPDARHDGVKFSDSSRKGDSTRAQVAGKPLHIRALVIQCRGDWARLKQGLGLTGWRGGRGRRICFKCKCTTEQMMLCGVDAPWRHQLESRSSFLDDVIRHNKYLCGLFLIPGFRIEMVTADLMHCSCLGILQYALGNAMWELFLYMGGKFKKADETCGKLVGMIKLMSKHLGVQPPLNNLTITMVRGAEHKKPKLKLKVHSGSNPALKCISLILSCLPLPVSFGEGCRMGGGSSV